MPDSVTITRDELDRVVREAVRQSAGEFRKLLGVPEDEDKAREFVKALHQAKDLVDAFNSAKRTVYQTVVRWVTVAALSAMALWLGWDKFVK